ncbi:hypothetical protein EMIHUDRAFT_106717 [Emiliania huxleyi CCMP1516]|uniref:Apple domain-containing protein n=2 Tax=Emiliania huxleyi TaxID=2903 RepID=A0A0D3I6A7_EMIH1|nr:hypothetical protein EMIHUDRAFT_106717 [Emiliania huxleyi CCMP1516]EOD06792.1 hypothetical protein EMIHUDRAFT_106717 [Emiliania huxleyi CCMP1516]|eukprot:XP_005759221.1 hypothetical protein EMIHUDRAFT_106717 [Emiliania huxleyi CCMP1516]
MLSALALVALAAPILYPEPRVCDSYVERGVWYSSEGWVNILKTKSTVAACAKACAEDERCSYWTLQLTGRRECHLMELRVGSPHPSQGDVHGACTNPADLPEPSPNGLGSQEMHVAFLTLGTDFETYVKRALATVRNIEARSEISATTPGNGKIFMYKPILHQILPIWVPRAVVLDTDVYFVSDIAGLWAQFDSFAARAVIGVAEEQCQSYAEVLARGGHRINGGVQLHELDRMRHSRRYADVLARIADKTLPPLSERGELGSLGDQSMYAWMSIYGRDLLHLLPCGWNRQTGGLIGLPGFWAANRCESPCMLVHGNHGEHKDLMEALKADPTGSMCKSTVRRFRTTQQFFKSGDHARMLEMLEEQCCPGSIPRRDL